MPGCPPPIISQIKPNSIKMELSLSGNSLKTFSRAINSLTRIGTELILQASRSQLVFHTLNSSRSAYQSVTFKSDFFDSYNLKIANNGSMASDLIQCSVLLKSVNAILRTPISNIDRLSAVLAEVDSPKLQWTLQCLNGVKKTYWISCNVEPDIQHLSLDRAKFPSNLVVRPRDLTRLLSNFQSSLHEITIIATDPSAAPSDASGEIGGKAVELKSYIDPTKDYSDSALHTQLWIDPAEEFVQYVHVGDPVDVTFGVKELKAFLAFCEGCEVDIHLFFEKAGEPILLAPKFSVDVGSYSDFDTTLVLATMLVSQLSEAFNSVQPPATSVPHAQDAPRKPTQSENSRPGTHPAGSEHPSSDHTKIWSDLSGSAAKSNDRTRGRQIQNEGDPILNTHNDVQMHDTMNSSMAQLLRDKASNTRQPVGTDRPNELQDRLGTNGNPHSQRHPSNWVGDDDEDEDEDDDGELYVQSTPQYDD